MVLIEDCDVVNALRIIIPMLVDRKSFELDSLNSSTDTENIEFVKWLIPERYCGILIGEKGRESKISAL
jgi:hypothetical protein